MSFCIALAMIGRLWIFVFDFSKGFWKANPRKDLVKRGTRSPKGSSLLHTAASLKNIGVYIPAPSAWGVKRRF